MPVRDFIDSAGTHWRVWNTLPSSRMVLITGFEHGWLTFEAEGSLRRLTPIPEGWDLAPEAELERLCAQAGRFERRRPTEGSRSIPPSGRDIARRQPG